MTCCGVDSWEDWAENPNYDPYNKPIISDPIFRPDYPTTGVPTDGSVPNSCCDPNKRQVVSIGMTTEYGLFFTNLIIDTNTKYF